MTRSQPGATLALNAFLPYRLAVLSNTISRTIADMYDREFGLTLWQWRIMAVVGEAPGLSATEAGARATMEKVAVSRAVSGLLERGLVSRTPASQDGRRFELRLTEAGMATYRAIAALALAFEHALLEGLDQAERATLERLMTRLAGLASPDAALW